MTPVVDEIKQLHYTPYQRWFSEGEGPGKKLFTKEIHVFFSNFPKDISPKVNVIAQLEFELTYYNVTVQHFSHYAIGTPPKSVVLN